MTGSGHVRKGIAVWTIKNAVFILFLGLIIIGGSGHIDWIIGWAYVIFMLLYIALIGVVLYRLNPGLLAERSAPQKRFQKGGHPPGEPHPGLAPPGHLRIRGPR